ncbi:N-acetylglucosamine-6-phosphate deacetylase [Salipaludibacillus daqingensis]|uniref:N-acetylglucosamine-6-phosphate deacetylase n=1 Tax=Salipaludibacillus daqingensis TaxID=3041001 RepID=UPI002473D439|nr:N-acetylglucosamine-6-phosphate deacetylase [Salipaludibacillus daqingensis]
MHTYQFENATLISEKGIVKNPIVSVDAGKIYGIQPFDEEIQQRIHEKIVFSEPVHIVPGFIDVHIHGVAGADVMDGTVEAIETMKESLPKEGTTSFLATTITQSNSEKINALQAVKACNEKNTAGAEIVGVHLEGPFISKKRAGAQPVEYIKQASVATFNDYQRVSGGLIKLVTMAPEEDKNGDLIKELRKQNVIASIGHSDATYEQILDAINDGMNHVTHLFNGMRGAHHRDIGVAGGAMLHDELMTEIIVDGIHVSPPMVKLAYKTKGNDRMIIVTDSMRAKGLEEGEYSLAGQKVFVSKDRAVLADGTLAGSIVKMNEAVKNMMDFTGCSLREAVQMASFNPAKQLGIDDRKGSLMEGKDADFCVLSEDLSVVQTYVMGQKVVG